MPTSTEDDNGWPEAVVREINLSAWSDFVGPLTRTDGGGRASPRSVLEPSRWAALVTQTARCQNANPTIPVLPVPTVQCLLSIN
eukprot:COSAG06_NODE_27943_length_583_cov_1.435950_1_plen_84_part_00